MYIFSSFCIYLIFVIFGMCSLVLLLSVIFYVLYFCWWYLLTKFSCNSIHEMHQNSWFITVVYFVNAYHCTNLNDPSWDFGSVATYLFLLLWQCSQIHIHMAVQSTDHIFLYLYMGSTDICKEIIFEKVVYLLCNLCVCDVKHHIMFILHMCSFATYEFYVACCVTSDIFVSIQHIWWQ